MFLGGGGVFGFLRCSPQILQIPNDWDKLIISRLKNIALYNYINISTALKCAILTREKLYNTAMWSSMNDVTQFGYFWAPLHQSSRLVSNKAVVTKS